MTQPIISPNDEDKLWSGLAYTGLVCCLIPTILIFLLKRDESHFIKFNCLQALGLGVIGIVGNVAFGILGRLPLLGLLVGVVYLLGSLVFLGGWVYLIVQSFMGKDVRIPLLAGFIEQNLMG